MVLGHGHTDHRGSAPALGVPVLCHPDEVVDAEGSGGWRYWPADLAGLPPGSRQLQRLLHRYAWDGGPVKISGTLSEGDEIAGFRVVHLPGHAPGLIALWRDSDRLALSTDCFYTVDMWGRDSDPARARSGLQLGHRSSARERAQARGARPRGGMARTRQAVDR